MNNEAWKQFTSLLKELNHYRRAITLLEWDMYTATPDKGYQGMADTLTFFSDRYFALSTSDTFYGLLQTLSAPENLAEMDEGMRYTVRTLLRDLTKDRRIPPEFQSRLVSARSASEKAWEEAKERSDYGHFAPHLGNMISLTRQQCAFTDPGKDTYDVLLDRFEEGIGQSVIDPVFESLKEGLLPLLDRILAKPLPKTSIFEGTYDPDAQKKVQQLLLDYIGFRSDSGTTAESAHPFTTGFSRWDLRVTNHYHPHNPISAMFSAIHEGGHAIFGQNVDPALEGTEADDCRYMGVHESQSRFFENILGRRRSFWVPIWPEVQKLLPDLGRVSLDEFMREVNRVQNSLIRTEADEVTYCLHIILRYEMEMDIFRGGASVSELPELWNRRTKELLHLTPANDAEGILQDMHWSDGSFGYFPSYLLGSIYDGMFLDAMTADLGDIDALLENGRIDSVRGWLNEKIHRYGSLRLPAQVIEEVCGKPLSAEPLLRYFEKKYSRICGF